MDKRTFFGLCAALAFAAGSTAVHAVKIVATTGDDPAADTALSSVTYAKETLETGATTEASDDSDETVYYNIDQTLILSGPAEISGNAGDTVTVSYTLDGMVFSAAPSVVVANNGSDTGTFTIAANGGVGDKSVVFRADAASEHATTAYIELNASFAISGAGSGGVTRILRNVSLEGLGIDSSKTHMAPGIVKASAALKESVMAMSPTADVAADPSFRKFVDDMNVATVGSLMVGFETHRLAQDADTTAGSAAGSAGDPVSDVNQLMDTQSSGTPAAPNSTVSIMGDFSFAANAYLHGDTDCGVGDGNADSTDTDAAPAAPGILRMEGTGDDAMVVGVDAQNVTAFATAEYLCIMVDPEAEDGMRIPETSAYTAMGDYMKIEAAAFDPVPMEKALGRIMRNGTTVRFPFLTSQMRYNQVLRITNRGSDTQYTFTSDAMDEEMEGTLMGGGMTTQMLVSDLIGEGVGSTAGSLTIEAQPSMIDVAVVHVNREDGSTDTVIYD